MPWYPVEKLKVMGRLVGLIWAILAAVLMLSCGGAGAGAGSSPPPQPTFTAISGVAQKGPLILGSAVTVQELNSSLSPNGKQYTYQVNSNLGTFNPTSVFSSQFLGINATGYYYDEVANAISSGTITLNGYGDLSTSSVLNVNLLTTLAYQRIQHLVQSGKNLSAANSQAESEVLAVFHIPPGTYGDFGTLDISKGTNGDQILAAISSVFVYGNSAGSLASLIASFQSDIGANGAITNSATTATLVASAKALDPAAVAANLTQQYSAAGISFTPAQISSWIDQDGDGLVGEVKFRVLQATPTSNFAFPLSVTDPYAGTALSVTAGQLSVNGTAASGAVTTKVGDVLSVMPPMSFTGGLLQVYLVSGSTKIGRASFYGHNTWVPAAGMSIPRDAH